MTGPTRRLAPALRSLLATSRQEPDRDLLGRFARCRDEAAFGELMSRHGRMVLGVSRRVTRDAHAAEDVFQATFLLLSRKAGSIRRPDALGAWLHRTAFRLALRTRRADARPRESLPERPGSPGPLDTLTAREILAVLDDELAGLSEEYRSAVVLCGLEGLSLEEAARRLGWTTGSVKGRLERGRALLRQRLARRGLTLPAVMAAPLLDAGALSPTLLQATRAAVFEAAAGASVLSLIDGGMPVMSATKASLIGAMLLLSGVLALGAVMRDERPPDQAPPPPAPAKGDPLPEGARLRLGSMDRRAFGTKMAVTADGRSIVVLRRVGQRVTEYDTLTGKVLRQREVPSEVQGGSLWGLSPDGRWLVTNPYSKTPGELQIVVTDLRTLEPAGRMSVKGPYMVSGAAFPADRSRLAAVGLEANKRRVYVWDWKAGTELLAGEVDGNHWCHQVALSPDGKYALLVGAANGGITCWEVASGKRLWNTREASSRGVVITPNGKVLSDEFAATLVERDLRTGEKTKTLRLPATGTLHYLALMPDGRRLVESGAKGVNVWDLQTGANVAKLPRTTWAEVLAIPDGKSILTNDGSLQRWDLATGEAAYPDESRKGHLDEVTALVFSADGRRLASASQDGSVGVWDTSTGRPIHLRRHHYPRRPYPHDQGLTHGGVEALDMTADGRRVASADSFECCRVFDTTDGKVVGSFRLPEMRGAEQANRVRHLRLDEEGRAVTGLLYPGFWQPGMKAVGKLMRWDVATGRPTTLGDVAGLTPWAGAIDPDGRFFTCAGQVFDARTGSPFGELAEHEAQSDASFSPDGMLVAGGPTWRQWDKRAWRPRGYTLHVRETLTGKVIARVTAAREPGDKVLHPSGRFLAVNEMTGLRVWDLRSEKEVKHWPMPKDASINGGAYRVSSFAFSPDGRTLATGHPDGTILLWDADLPAARSEPLRPGEPEALWKQLADADAKKAYHAAWRLAELPGKAIALLSKRLKPAAPAPAAETAKLIAGLDDDTQSRRDEASKQLAALGAAAEPALREALKSPASPEQRRRLERLLAALASPSARSAARLRELRAVQVLGWMGTPEARKILQSLAAGVPSDPVTQQAKVNLARRR
jgi:RNA polymerase sigma factor (sigma-70 family)